MRNLFKMEFLRHRHLAFGFGLLHLLILYYLLSLNGSFLARPTVQMWVLAMLVLTAALGIYQMSLNKRNNDWLYLLHRPLPTKRIFLALALAGCALAFIVVLAPVTLMLITMDLDGMFGIELRHYKVLLYIAAMVLTTYFCSCFAVLSASRLGYFALVLPTVFILALRPSLILTAYLLIIPAFALAWIAFKADHSRQPERIGALAVAETAIQYGCMFLIAAAAFVFAEIAWSFGSNPYRNPPDGTDFQVMQLAPEDRMQFALAESDHPDAAFLSQQVVLGEISRVGNPAPSSYPKRYQLPFTDNKLVLTDAEQNVRWTFNHGVMLFEGRDIDTADRVGWLGPQGFHFADTQTSASAFDSVPWAATNEFIIDDHRIYQIDWDIRQLTLRFDKSRHEQHTDRFSDSLTISENLTTLISETALYIFSSSEFQDQSTDLRPRAVLTLPSNGNPGLRVIDILELIDGFLVSVLADISPSTISADFALYGQSQLQLYRVRPDFVSEVISRVNLPSAFSELHIYKDFIAAPGVRVLMDMFWGFHWQKNAERTFPLLHMPFPAWVWAATLLNCALCASIVGVLLRRSPVPRRTRIFWIVSTALTGLAGLFSFVIGNYWRGTDQFKISKAAAEQRQRRASAREVSPP